MKNQEILYLKTLFSRVVLITFLIIQFSFNVLAQESEPNNSAANANNFGLNSSLTAYIGTDSDAHDWFKITTQQEGTLTITSTSSENEYYYLNLIDVNAERNLASASVSSGETDSVSRIDLKAGTYYLKVSKSGSYVGNYTLTNRFIPAKLQNDNEPNDSVEDAQLFTVNSSTTGRLNYILDNVRDANDWYKITIPEEGTLKFKSTSSDIYNYYISLFDVDSARQLAHTAVTSGETDSISRIDLQAGTYYLLVSYSGTYVGSYTVTNRFTPALLQNDNEPNDSVEDTQEFTVNSSTTGRLNYIFDNVRDANDWYRITIPEEGTLKVTSTSSDIHNYYITLFDVDSVRQLAHAAVTSGENDSIYRIDIQAGTYYLLVSYSGTYVGSYKVTNSFTPALFENDSEPNNSVEEVDVLSINSTTTGRLNYRLNNKPDLADWYSITIPEEGILKVTSKSPDIHNYYITLYDVDSVRQLAQTAVTSGETDSISRMNLQAGTYYLVVSYSSNYVGSYTVTNSFTSALLENDTEPNNMVEESSLISIDSVKTGRLNYVLNTVYDTKDWFNFTISQPGGVKITSTSPDIYNYYVTLIDNDTIRTISTATVTGGETETIYGWGLDAGKTYYIRIDKSSNYFGSYQLNTEFQPAPMASFDAVQSLSSVFFTNTSEYATSYHWDFGDGNTSNKVNPSHTYTSPGAFEVTLTASNPNGDVEYSEFVEFRGIQKVEGKHGGNTGSSTITIYAGGLKPGSVPIIRKGGIEIVGTNIISPNTGQIQGVFDLVDEELGEYDVVVKNPGEAEMVLFKAYTVEVGNDPSMYVELTGRNRALLNRWSTYTVEFGNRGNTDAYYQILWLAVPDSIEFKNLEFNLGLYNNPEVESYLANCPPYWELNMLDNAPFNGRLYGIPFNKVPADSKFSIEFKVKAIEDFQLSVFTTNPWFEVNAVGGTKSNSESMDIATMSYNKCVAWAIATIIRDKLAGELTGLIPGADCFYGSVKTLSELSLSYTEGKLTVTSLSWNLAQVAWGCAKDVGKNIPIIKALKASKIIVDVTIDIINSYSADQECQKYKKKDSKDKHVNAVTSLDPNEIVGPSGFGDANYVNGEKAVYKIYFENKNTATANAIEVWVIDTIDINKFDMSTFKFDNIWIAGNHYEVIEDSSSFSLDVDLRPRLNTIVRVNGTVDRETGIANWHFLSLDPGTMDITEDPDSGFLPPNNTSPEGEGFVGYSITLKENLVQNSTFSAQAKIVFDFNEPIFTNIYSNTIDRESPVSNIYEILPTDIENVYEIFWEGNDDKSGINYFNIYKSENGGEFTLWNSANENLSDTLRVDPNISYRFFSQSVDKLGNVEPYKGYSEQTVGINEMKQNTYGINIYPNPIGEKSIVQYSTGKSENISISISNMSGQILKTIPAKFHTSGKYEIQLNSAEFAEGMYIISVQGDLGSSVTKFIVN